MTMGFINIAVQGSVNCSSDEAPCENLRMKDQAIHISHFSSVFIASTILGGTVATAAYIKRVKQRKTKNKD
jgi:hypothetical protein